MYKKLPDIIKTYALFMNSRSKDNKRWEENVVNFVNVANVGNVNWKMGRKHLNAVNAPYFWEW